jgi:asparagine N-glycosylation enzyme membrane subunit Stt3
VYLAGKKLFGNKAGILGALAIAIMPYHMWHSHYALGDVPMAFLISWALYFSALIIKRDHIKNYILSGLFVGLAASVKYSGGLTALMVPVTHFLKVFWKRSKDVKKKVKILDVRSVLYLFSSGLAAFLGFLAVTPYALLDFETFSSKEFGKGAFWQFENVGSVGFSEHFVKFFTESFGRLLVDTGYVVIPFFFAGLIYLLYKLVKKKTEEKDIFLVFLYSISLFLIWYLSGFKNSRSHYYFIVYPYLAVIFGYLVFLIQDKMIPEFLKQKNEGSIKILSSVFVLLISSPLFVNSSVNAYRYYRGDTRNLLHEWLIDNYNPPEALVYNERALEDIFGNIGIRASKGLEKFDDFSNSLIVVRDPNEEESEFLEKNGSKLEEVVRFDSNLRLGDDIEVYRYSAPEEPVEDCGCGR